MCENKSKALREKFTPAQLLEGYTVDVAQGRIINKKGREVGSLRVNACGRHSIVMGFTRGDLTGKVSRSVLIWAYVNGRWPDLPIDHINNKSLDDRIDNLKELPQDANIARGRCSKRNRLGVRGISRTRHKSYVAYISRGKTRLFKTFKTLTAAMAWRAEKQIELYGVEVSF